MANSNRAVQVPGGALNNTDDDPNSIAAEREQATVAAAAADALKAGDIDKAQALMHQAAQTAQATAAAKPKRKRSAAVDVAKLGPGVADISVPNIRRDPDAERWGPELSYPAGTQLDKDKRPCAGGERAHYVVGNILDESRGWVIGRAIPLSDEGAE